MRTYTPEELEKDRRRHARFVVNVSRFGNKYARKRILKWNRIFEWAGGKTQDPREGRRFAHEARDLIIPNWKRGYAISPIELKLIMMEVLKRVGAKRLASRRHMKR